MEGPQQVSVAGWGEWAVPFVKTAGRLAGSSSRTSPPGVPVAIAASKFLSARSACPTIAAARPRVLCTPAINIWLMSFLLQPSPGPGA